MTTKEQCLRTPQTKNLTSEASESNTDVNMIWRGPKSVHSFRCSDKLWKDFVSETKASGSSVCHVMEAIIAAVLGVLKANVYNRNTITIENLSVQRVVRRHRRVSHKCVPEENCWDPVKGWFFVDDSVLNDNGHAIGCACKICRRFSRA